jgi:hypothetical protein
VNPSSHQVRNGNICDSTPVPKILVNRISHHCPTKFGDIRGRANRKNGKYVARYRHRTASRTARTLRNSSPLIAIFPLILRQHWERHYQKLCALVVGTTCGYYVFVLNGAARVQHAAGEYATFIVVVGTFFVVTGAIHLHIPRPASPLANVTFLFSGSILANFIGTIGASMLLLRPFPHMNRGRGSAMHVAFFIFTIGNLGVRSCQSVPHFSRLY